MKLTKEKWAILDKSFFIRENNLLLLPNINKINSIHEQSMKQQNINYISTTVNEHLINFGGEINANENIDSCGILLLSVEGLNVGLMYHIIFLNGCIHLFQTCIMNNVLLYLTEMSVINNKIEITKDYSLPINNPLMKIQMVEYFWLIVKFEWFRRHANHEIKFTSPQKRKIKINGQKYLNNSTLPINIIDSTYYTTTISLHDFSVCGHYRVQPYGKGREKSKIIYINEFQKHGYKRRAKIDRIAA